MTASRKKPARLRPTWQEANTAGPGLIVLAGGVFLVSPTTRPELDDQELVNELLAATAADFPGERAALLAARAEEAMGTTDYHRLVALHSRGLISDEEADRRRECLRRKTSEARRRMMLSRQPVAPPRDPTAVEKITMAQEAAARAQAQADTLRSEDARRHRKEIKRLEQRARQFAADANQAWEEERRQDRLLGEAHDPVIRAKLAGRDVEVTEVEAAEWVKDEHGAQVRRRRGQPVIKYETSARLFIRDGLMSALRSGYITEVDYEFGLVCRGDYEARSGDGASQLGDSSGGGHDNDRFVRTRLKRAKRTNRIAMVERAVQVACHDEPACLQMLREIVGAGKSLSAFGEGRAVERHGNALARALRVGRAAAVKAAKAAAELLGAENARAC